MSHTKSYREINRNALAIETFWYLTNQVNIISNITNGESTSFDVPKKDGLVWKEHYISGICPFLYKAETWDKKASTQILKTSTCQTKLDIKTYVLQGNKTPEQLILWLKNYDNKINKNMLLSLAEKLAMLKRIVNNDNQLWAK